jgi:hypothetical protein
MPFEKGKSGNPGGRPKGDAQVRDLARKHTAAAIAALVGALKAESESARVAAANALLDRGWGKPAQTIDATVTDNRMVIEAPATAADGEDWERQYGRPN